MANGVQLATAYISLNVRTDEIKKQVSSALNGVSSQGRAVGQSIGSNMMSGMREHLHSGGFTSILQPIAVAGVTWAAATGRKIGAALRTAVVTGVSAGVGAALLGAGAVLSAGLSRLKTEQEAEIRLSLTLDPASIKDLKNKIKEVVKGTPMALDTAFNISVPAVNSGMSNEQVAQYIKDIADLTAATGHVENFEHLGEIMDKVRSKTKLTGEEMQQLIENQVDLRGLLKQGMGWDDKTLNAKIKSNKISFDNLQKSIQKVYGSIDAGNGKTGLAQKAGGTLGGSIGNVRAAMGRLGAGIIDTLFGEGDDPMAKITRWTGQLTDKLDDVTAFFVKNKGTIREYFTNVGHAFKNVWEWLGKAKDKASDVGSKIASGFNYAKDAVQSFIDKLKDIWNGIKTWVLDKWDAAFGPNSAIGKFMKMLGIGMPTASADTGSTGLNTGPTASNAIGGALPGGALSGVFGGGVGSGGAPMSGSVSGNGKQDPFVSQFDVFGRAAAGGGGAGPAAVQSAQAYDANNPRRIGSDQGMLPDAVALKNRLTTLFPEITDVGGYRPPDNNQYGQFDEHASGKAFDIMVPKQFMDPQTGKATKEGIAWGNRVLAEALAQGASVLWQQTQFDPDGSKTAMSDRGGDPTQNHFDHLHVLWGSYANYASGGGVRGIGSGTSDSIPAMLSNGEHVLTAEDVKRMGGQQGVYAFRSALKAGLIPGYAPGGAVGPVDPSTIQNAQDSVADLTNQAAVAKARWDEVQANADATDTQKVQATQEMVRTQRALDQAQQDLPIIMAGGTPPDRSKQNRVYDLTDQLDMANRALQDLQASDTASGSQILQAQYNVESLKRERGQAINDLQGKDQGPNYGMDFIRSLGFIPAAAGSTSVAGTSSLAGFINMGNSVVSGVIDTGVNLANQAVSGAIAAGVAAGSFGGAAAAAPLAQMAASYGIQLAGNEAKRISQYWFGLAGIGADALLEIMSPFGVPRFLGYDYTQFAPQLGIQQAALGTLEQMGGDAINKYFAGQQQGNPVIPGDPTAGGPSGPVSGSFSIPGTGPALNGSVGGSGGTAPMDTQGQLNVDPFARLNDPNNTGAGGAGGGGSWARGGAVGIYDNGGILKPGQLALNASSTPESILTKQQWTAMMANASSKPDKGAPLVNNLYAQDMQSAIRELEKVKRRDMMQYAGRP